MNREFALTYEMQCAKLRGEPVDRRRMNVLVPSGPSLGNKHPYGVGGGGPQGTGPSAAVGGLAPERPLLRERN